MLAQRAGRASGAPPILAQRRGVDVGVESQGHLERVREGAAQVGVLPAGLGSGGDVAVGGRLSVEIHRSERADADASYRVGMGVFAKEPDDAADGLGRRVVAKRASATRSLGPLPTTQAVVVPPVSMPP